MPAIDLATAYDSQAGRRFGLRRLMRGGAWTFGAMFPTLASHALERVFLTPIVNTRLALDDGPLTADAALHLPHGAGRLATWHFGDGPTVLFIHGWGGRAAQFAAFIRPLVEAGYRAVMFDAPAHGLSSGRQTHLMDFVRATSVVADAHGPPVAVVAHSFGAPVATWAIHSGLSAERLVLFAPPVDMSRFVDFAARYVGFPNRVTLRLQRRLEARFGITLAELSTDRVAASLGLPLLVLHDVEDRQARWQSGAAVAEAAGGRFIKTEGLGHTRILSAPETVGEAVAFIRGKPCVRTPPHAAEKPGGEVTHTTTPEDWRP